MTDTHPSFEQIRDLAIAALEDIKAVDIHVIDMREGSSFTDCMIIASGNTDRQVRALAQNLIRSAKEAGIQPLGIEGEQQGEWVLVDLGDVVVHIMQPAVREFYNIEKLWGESSPANAGKV